MHINTDELHSQDLQTDSSSDLDFGFSSDECPEVPEFAAESPELQGIHMFFICLFKPLSKLWTSMKFKGLGVCVMTFSSIWASFLGQVDLQIEL